MKHRTPGLVVALFLAGFLSVWGQTYKVEGIVKDQGTDQPIIGASIVLKNSGQGTSANDQGVFKLEVVSFPAYR